MTGPFTEIEIRIQDNRPASSRVRITRRGGSGRMANAHTVAAKSSPAAQHKQPLPSRTTSMESIDWAKIASSMPTAPNSLTMTAEHSIAGCLRSAAMSVVLPLPRNPVISESGM